MLLPGSSIETDNWMIDFWKFYQLSIFRFENFLSGLPEVREKNPAVFDGILIQLIKHLQVNLKVLFSDCLS